MVEKDRGPRVGLDVQGRQGPVRRAEIDFPVARQEVERVYVGPSVARDGGDARNHCATEDFRYHRIVKSHRPLP